MTTTAGHAATSTGVAGRVASLVEPLFGGTLGPGSPAGGGPFIEAFSAPEMSMRPEGETVALIEDAGVEVRDVHSMREHSVRTVQAWYDTIKATCDRVTAMVGEEVARTWRLYLVGGALAFEEGRMDVDQIVAVRRGARGESGMPAVRR